MEELTGETVIEQNEEERICPYLEIQCQEICPGWIASADDCLFHVCLTQVKETFTTAAKYLDQHLGLAEGAGMDTITGLRQVMNGTATDAQKEIVRSVLGSLISTGVLTKISTMTVSQISSLVSKVESKISFAFSTLFQDE
jgi:hypothetical protein